MKLKRLLKDFPELVIKGSKEVEISGICAHSKYVVPGNLFIVKKGRAFDGSQFISQAVQSGAAAILTDLHDPFLDVVQIIHPNPAQIEAKLAAEYYRHPSKELSVIGITGTNGKTTCSYLIKHLLDKCNQETGLIGTVEWIIGKNHFTPSLTTPDVVTNHKLLREMILEGCRSGVMEVSSHALDQNRIEEIHFSAALFTNLTEEHLDYHVSMEEYGLAKAKLFRFLSKESGAIFNIDDPYFEMMVRDCPAKILTYGIEKKADIYASHIELSEKMMQFHVHVQGNVFPFKSDLIGKFNIYNLLAAISLGVHFSIPVEKIIEILKTFKKVPGRLERVKNNLGMNIFVDYAHTPDALKNVLSTLKSLKKGKIITVFGCGGNRDASKRSKMASVVEQLSDIAIVTTDNPRNEDPVEIAKEVFKGFLHPQKVILQLDRKKAIEAAISYADSKDLILIAGKGHETKQIFAHSILEFDDRKVAEELCAKKEQDSLSI